MSNVRDLIDRIQKFEYETRPEKSDWLLTFRGRLEFLRLLKDIVQLFDFSVEIKLMEDNPMEPNQFISWNEINGQQSWELIQVYLNQGYEVIASGGDGMRGYVIMRLTPPQIGPSELKAMNEKANEMFKNGYWSEPEAVIDTTKPKNEPPPPLQNASQYEYFGDKKIRPQIDPSEIKSNRVDAIDDTIPDKWPPSDGM